MATAASTSKGTGCVCHRVDRATALAVTLYGLLALTFIMFDELFSTFCQAPAYADNNSSSRLFTVPSSHNHTGVAGATSGHKSGHNSSKAGTAGTAGDAGITDTPGTSGVAGGAPFLPFRVGLGFDTDQVGIALSIGGAALLIYQGFFFHRICSTHGVVRCFFWSTVCMAPLFLAFPALGFLTAVEGTNVPLWAGLAVAVVAKNVLAATAFTSVMLLIK